MIRSSVLALVLAAALSPSSSAEPVTYEIDGVHSAAVFSVSHLGVGTAWGRFNQISGSFIHDPAKPDASSVSVTINAESVDSGDAKRDQHLRSPDFFDAKQFPELKFQSKTVKEGEGGDLEITGDLTLRGVTKSITVRADHVGEGQDPWGKFRKGYDLEFSIARSDFGVSYMPGGLGESVRIFLSVEGVRK